MDIDINKIRSNPSIISICNRIADAYRNELKKHDSIATGKLYDFDFEIEISKSTFSVNFNLPDYWKYVEYGRGPGKQPPIEPITRWITVKHIVPRAYKNKVPTAKQLAFMISKSIGRHGTKGTHALETATDNSNNLFLQLKEELTEEINNQLLDKINKQLEKW